MATVTRTNSKKAKLAPTEAVTLPPLKINIYSAGELVRQVEIPDPRVNFCRFWAEMHAGENSVAVPCPECTVRDDDELARFAVVQLDPPRVIARLLTKVGAEVAADLWSQRHGQAVIVRERISLQTITHLAADALGRDLTHGEAADMLSDELCGSSPRLHS